MGRGTGRWSVNGNQLKLLAIFAMLVDHWAIVFVPGEFAGLWLLRLVGRLTAPIMCYLIAEGYWHTSGLRRYLGRLLLVALVSHVPHALCFGFDPWRFWEATDVMFALLLGLIALTAWGSPKLALWQKLGATAGCCLLAYPADWNYIAVLWIVGFGVFRGSPARQMLAFSAVGVLYLLQPLVYGTSFPYISRVGVFLAIPCCCATTAGGGAEASSSNGDFTGSIPPTCCCCTCWGGWCDNKKARAAPGLFSVLRQQKRQAEWLASFRWWR